MQGPNPPHPAARLRAPGSIWVAPASLILVLLSVFVFTSRQDGPPAGEAGATLSTPAAGGAGDPAIGLDPDGRVSIQTLGSTESDATGGADVGIADHSGDTSPGTVDGSAGGHSVIAAAAASATPLARPGLLPPGPETEPLRDDALGLATWLPEGWQRVSLQGEDAPWSAADHDLVLEDPATGARLALSAWDAGQLPPLHLWLPGIAAGLQSVDGKWPVNAQIAGVPALVLWSPEDPTTPGRYAAFLSRGGRYYRLAYSARDGGAAVGAFVSMLARLTWLDASGSELTSSSAALVPPLPLPSARYFPGEGLAPSR